ncbi:hypothetical protein [Photorhabdus sp. S14-60]|nr:hypothetical protein [Photorhabdus sp. S14-60]
MTIWPGRNSDLHRIGIDLYIHAQWYLLRIFIGFPNTPQNED